MNTIKLNRATYKISDSRQDFMSALLKCTGKHRRVKSKGAEKRIFPPYGASQSTADYVAAYELANSGRWPRGGGAPYGTESTSCYAGLTTHITVPEGADMVELCSG
jgi:hypothetical protein